MVPRPSENGDELALMRTERRATRPDKKKFLRVFGGAGQGRHSSESPGAGRNRRL
jgi:hypothetical protein